LLKNKYIMKKILEETKSFYSMLEYFTTKKEDDTTGLPSIPSKPFNENAGNVEKVLTTINNEYLEGTKIKCVTLK